MLHIDKARAARIEDVIAGRNIKLSPGRVERCGPCPRCGGTDRFSINTRKQVFNCRRCGAKGDVIALVQLLDGVDFNTAVEVLGGPAPENTTRQDLEHGRHLDAARQKAVDDRERESENSRRLGALAMWRQSVPEDGTGLAARYLREERGIAIPADDWTYLSPRVIRFHPHCPFGKDKAG